MYTEKSVDLKNDFYARYGEARGRLYFEKVGFPCVLFDAGNRAKLVFAFDCGVRAYGRGYGDVLRVLNSDTNVCDVHFVKNGKGAQILYRQDISDLRGMRQTAIYTINKLLYEMGSTGRLESNSDIIGICDKYAPSGWCAVKDHDSVKSAPLPLNDYNILLVRVRNDKLVGNDDMLRQFHCGEYERIRAVYTALKECKVDVLFDMINESERAIERLLSPKDELLCAVRSAYGADGVCAVKICDCGVVSFVEKERTDSVALAIRNECRKSLGYSARISVVK